MSRDSINAPNIDFNKIDAPIEPEHCPGPNSKNAGFTDACANCPSKDFCKNVPKKQDPDLTHIRERLQSIRHKILVLSGKGGVGKSTITSQFSYYLADLNDASLQVGIMDVDICGPSIPRMMGVMDQSMHQNNLGWEPVYLQDNLSIVSVAFLLEDEEEAVIWRGPRKNGLIKQFMRDVYWGDNLDYLIIDTPPGTSDEHLSIFTYLKDAGITGAIIVTTQQEVSLMDVRKEINFCKKLKIPIIGVIENMSGFVCPKCHTTTNIFVPTTEGAQKMCEEMQVRFLGSIPLDPIVSKLCDEGKSVMKECDQSSLKTITEYKKIFEKTIQIIEDHQENADTNLSQN